MMLPVQFRDPPDHMMRLGPPVRPVPAPTPIVHPKNNWVNAMESDGAPKIVKKKLDVKPLPYFESSFDLSRRACADDVLDALKYAAEMSQIKMWERCMADTLSGRYGLGARPNL